LSGFLVVFDFFCNLRAPLFYFQVFTMKISVFIIALFCSLLALSAKSQLVVTNAANASSLAQKLVGEGISISNVTFTGNLLMTGFFKNQGNTNINLDSGIVLTSGRAKTVVSSFENGVDGNGTSFASSVNASNDWSLPGDLDLATAIGSDVLDMNDACVLEFDFIPSGDSVKFRYVFSSEEYVPAFACELFNDAFAFFISGPGITGQRNIALVPNTNLPVSIENINNVLDFGSIPLCPANPGYYVSNSNNTRFTHDGHTIVLTALSRVTPCVSYHLKLVIADNFDDVYDSGVFLEARSLSSNQLTLINNTQLDSLNNTSYLVEGCVNGAFKVKRPLPSPTPLSISLSYSGTAVNGVDVQLLPLTVTIPANDTVVLVNVVPIVDNLPEGIETLKIYGFANCNSVTPTDSTTIQIRDYDILSLVPDSSIICRGSAIQLTASAGYNTYQWSSTPGLSSYTVNAPFATPSSDSTTFICTATIGNCNARDSVFLSWKSIKLDSVKQVNCRYASTGQIHVSGSGPWIAPVRFSINGGALQSSGHFTNLPVGNYLIRISDAGNCIDSLFANITQAYPDLNILDTAVTASSCTAAATGTITITAGGGKPPYRYALDNGAFQTNNVLNVATGIHTISVKDSNACVVSLTNIFVPFINTVTLATGANPVICESESTTLPASTNAVSVRWTPVATLNNAALLNPIANPVVTTKYYITATTGVCTQRDSVTVIVNPAPMANAGTDTTVCYGGEISLLGSGGTDYSWSPATLLINPTSANPIASGFTGPQKIKFWLSVKDANGCTSLSQDTMTLYIPPPAKLFAGRDTFVAIRQPLQLMATDINNIGFVNYAWEPSAPLNDADIRNPVATLTAAITNFVVTATTSANCSGKDTVIVKTYRGPEIYVAGAFTPNADGTNDLLKAFPVGIKSFSYFNIYNRYGQQVFSTTNQNKGWDGRFKGSMQSMGTYVWIAAGIDYKGNLVQRKGTTMIMP
jgi:gliding motility-associated-like protein